MRDKILLTGGSGFIGSHFLKLDAKEELISVSLVNNKPTKIDYSKVKAIVHLAGIAHRMDEPSGSIYYEVNKKLTAQFAACAKAHGVSQFIYISTIKVFGVEKTTDKPLTEKTPCSPIDDYGKSKLAGEKAVQDLADPNFLVSIVRLPLVYGQGVKGNMARLIHLIQKGWPLPFGKIHNHRSMVYVGNIIELVHVIIAQKATGIFLAADPGKAVSTTQLIKSIELQLGKTVFLFSLPFRSLLRKLKPALAIRLFDSLEVDDTWTRQRLNFDPPYTFQEGIRKMLVNEPLQ